jgi:hypothetical protein
VSTIFSILSSFFCENPLLFIDGSWNSLFLFDFLLNLLKLLDLFYFGGRKSTQKPEHSSQTWIKEMRCMLYSLLILYVSLLSFDFIIEYELNNAIYLHISSVRKAAGERRSSDRRSNNFSWISEVKGISNVVVKKKRGRRAPPSAKRSRGKNVDKLIDSGGSVGEDIEETKKGQVGTSQSIGHIEESVDGRTDDPDISKKDRSGDSSDGPSSAPEEQNLSANSKDIGQRANPQTAEKVSTNRMRSKQGKCQNNLENEDGSCMDSAAVKKVTNKERSPRETKDYVSFF